MGNLFFDEPGVCGPRGDGKTAKAYDGKLIHVGDWVMRIPAHSGCTFSENRGPFRVYSIGSEGITLEATDPHIRGSRNVGGPPLFEWDSDKFEVVEHG